LLCLLPSFFRLILGIVSIIVSKKEISDLGVEETRFQHEAGYEATIASVPVVVGKINFTLKGSKTGKMLNPNARGS